MLQCPTCNYTFKTATGFRRHAVICQMLRSNTIDKDDETEDILTMKEMCIVVQQLVKDNHKLKEKVTCLEKLLNKKKEPINAIDCLNNSFNLNIDYKDFIKDFVIERKHLFKLFEKHIWESISMVIVDHLKKMEDNDRPLKAFHQKTAVLYIYTNNMWTNLSENLLKETMKRIWQKLIGEFQIWQKEDEGIEFQKKNGQQYYKYMEKIFGGKNGLFSGLEIVEKRLYNNIKYDVNKIVKQKVIF